MNKDEAEKLIHTIRGFIENVPGGSGTVQHGKAPDVRAVPPVPANGRVAPADEESQYQRIKARLLNDLKTDPIFLQLLAAQPEIVLEIEPKKIQLDTTSGKGRLAKLAAEGFFNQPRIPAEVKKELTKTGPEPNPSRMSEALTALVNDGFLVRGDGTYELAAGVKVSTHYITTKGA